MKSNEARAVLERAGLSIADLVNLLVSLGDDRQHATIVRCCHAIFAQKREDDVPWAVHLMLHYIENCKSLEKKLDEQVTVNRYLRYLISDK